jgi:hypothetical protein
MRITGYYDEYDLRMVVGKSQYLRRMARYHKLKNNEAICFTNRALTRFRLILKINDSLFMCIPEIDEQNKLSVYLRISEELASMASMQKNVIQLNLVSDKTRKRIALRKKRAANAKKRAANAKKRAKKKKKAA